jgi:hypothetical protein
MMARHFAVFAHTVLFITATQMLVCGQRRCQSCLAHDYTKLCYAVLRSSVHSIAIEA